MPVPRARTLVKSLVSLALATLLLAALAPAAQARKYLDINQPQLRRIPVAIPDFLTESKKPAAAEAARKGREVLESDLRFTGFFKVLPPESFLTDLSGGVSGREITFKDWTAIGAELLVSCKVRETRGRLSFEMRLFDTVRNQALAGKIYSQVPKDQVRQVMHRFAGEIVYALTGTYGIFDSKIAFVSTTPGNKEIYVADFDGDNPRQVTSGSDIALSPAWSHDGRYLAFISYQAGAPHLYILNWRLRQGFRVERSDYNQTPAWKPGVYELAAAMNLSGDQEIYTLTSDGKIIKRLTDSWGIDVSPTWSPDGKKLAFVSERSGGVQIFVMDVGTGKTRRVSFTGSYNADPCWSPAGDRIAYVSMERGEFDIYTMGPEGENPVRLTSGRGTNESPTWSPDGTLIAFASTREGLSRIYVMTAGGADQRRLLAMPGQQTQPSWSPDLKTSH